MSGHSKWSTIKHKKAATDAKRGKAWSKLVRDVTMTAKMGGGDPGANARLRLAIDKAKADNVPKDTIEKAVKKGTGELEGVNYEEVLYEGYGPAGVAIMAKAATDNRTRTAPEMRKLFERHGGNLGASNCVAWMFQPKGVIVVNREDAEEDRFMELALEAGAEDVSASERIFEIICDPLSFERVRDAVKTAGIAVASADVTMIAANQVTLELENARKALALVEALEEHEDVQSVSSNFDIPEPVLAQLEKER